MLHNHPTNLKGKDFSLQTAAVVTAPTRHLHGSSHQRRIQQHLLKNRLQCSCSPDPHLALEGLALLTHKPGPFSFSSIFTATDRHSLGYSAFQNENPGAQTLQSAVLSLTSQVRNTAHNIQTGSMRMDPAKEEEIQWITASCLLHLLLCTHLLQLFEATQSSGLKILGKNYLTQPPTQHSGHSH